MNKRKFRSRRAARTKAILAKGNLPRLVVFRSARHIYGQIVKPSEKGDLVIAQSSSLDKEFKAEGPKVDQAHQVGLLLAARAKKMKLENVCFDRSGYKYHGRVMALANGAREGGLIF